MGWSIHHPTRLIHSTPELSYEGYTLIATNYGFHASLIDMEGRVCHRWESPAGISYCYLLPNGNLLSRSHPPKGLEVGNLGGSAASLQELDWESNVVWEYRNPMLHIDFERLSNGNTLVLLYAELAPELAARVRGGHAEGGQGRMWGDAVQEVTPEGATVYEWRSWEHLSVEEDVICPLDERREWTHGNALSTTAGGDLLMSFRQLSVVGIVDRATGDFRWKWGPGELSHQHHPTYLDNGHVLIFDNGPHRHGLSYSRVVEVDPATSGIVWEYHGEPRASFFSYNISGAERLPNGNTLICEGLHGRIFEVTPQGQIVWEWVNPFAVQRVERGNAGPGGAAASERNAAVFRAHRYGPDHAALRGRDLDPARYAHLNAS